MILRSPQHDTSVFDGRKIAYLRTLATQLIRELETIEGVTEGIVRHRTGAPAYRRVVCEQRTLAFVRTRPRLRGVRVDVTGGWKVPRSRLELESSSATTLLVRSEIDVVQAVDLLRRAVDRKRSQQA